LQKSCTELSDYNVAPHKILFTDCTAGEESIFSALTNKVLETPKGNDYFFAQDGKESSDSSSRG
jgi:hypothetical protein